MIRRLTLAAAATFAIALIGCAGGWRGGTPPGGAPTPDPAGASVPRPSDAQGATFVYRGEGASVAVAGEFNGWDMSADPMTKQADGSWRLVKRLDPGRYAYKFVVDGSTWKEDPAAKESVDDGYGGKNSIVVVGAGAAGAPAAAAPKPAAAKPAAGGAGTTATATGARFVYRGAGASVAVAGEFNGWNTSEDPMTKAADGSWVLDLPLDPGRYAYKFVVDGGTWKADEAAAESVDDGFGGMNSIIVVGAGAAGAAAAPAAPAVRATAPTATGRAPEPTASGVRFTFVDPAAKTVHLAGEFNGWSTTTDALTQQTDGTWTIVRRLETGRWQYKFVVNGTTWKTDDANPNGVDDGFGGKNSVVVVE